MTPQEKLNLIRSLELKWRETHNSHVEAQLTKALDSFLGTFCVPMMYQWVKYTKNRHREKSGEIPRLNEELDRILESLVKAETLDQKLIAVERAMNARHYTNYFPDHLRVVSEGKKTAYQEYYENAEL